MSRSARRRPPRTSPWAACWRVVSANQTEASIGDLATVTAEGDATVKVASDSLTVMIAGGIGAAGRSAWAPPSRPTSWCNDGSAPRSASVRRCRCARPCRSRPTPTRAAVTAVVAGLAAAARWRGRGDSVNVMSTETEATIGQAAQVNTDVAFQSADQQVSLSATGRFHHRRRHRRGRRRRQGGRAQPSTPRCWPHGQGDDRRRHRGRRELSPTCAASGSLPAGRPRPTPVTTVSAGFAGGGTAGVGGAVKPGHPEERGRGFHRQPGARVDSDGNVLVNADEEEARLIPTVGGRRRRQIHRRGGGSLAVHLARQCQGPRDRRATRVNARRQPRRGQRLFRRHR